MGSNETILEFKDGKIMKISNKTLKQIKIGSLKVRDDFFRLKLDVDDLKKEEKRIIEKFLH